MKNLDDTIQFAFPSDLEHLHKYVVAKTYDEKKKKNITRVTPLVDNKFVIGSAITKVTGQWIIYTLCKAYSTDGSVERVSISDPIVATVTENDFDISEIEATEIDPNIKIIYDELIEFKKTLETNEATRQENENERVNAEINRTTAETARAEAETTRLNNEQARVDAETLRVTAEQDRDTAETARAEAEANREGTINKLREDVDNNTKNVGITERSLSALWGLNKGISYRFESDTEKAYKKTIPTGAKLGTVNKLGGKTIVYNQYSNMLGRVSFWSENVYNYKDIKKLSNHKLYVMYKYVVTKILDNSRSEYLSRLVVFGDSNVVVGFSSMELKDITVGKTAQYSEIIQSPNNVNDIMIYCIGDDKAGKTVECNTWVNIIDLTQMFGSGNEPSTVKEFESMFPSDYYPYSEGTLMSMGTKEVLNVGNRSTKLKYTEVRNSGVSGIFENFQIEEGTTATAFSPNKEATYTIPQAILNIEGYGWGVNNAYNYVDYKNKKFYKYVGRVDLSTLQFVYTAYGDNNDLYGFRSPFPQGIKKDDNAFSKTNNLLCSKYPDTPWQGACKGKDKTISQLSQSLQINDSAFTDAEAFKQSLQGEYLYYELAEPVVTDISDIIGDTFQEPFEVESGGSLTFKNVNGDGYNLAVPSDVEYTVKLNEVTP